VSAPTWSRKLAVGAAAVAVTVALAALLLLGGGAPTHDPRSALEARAAVLDAQVALAKEDARYLLLDPERGTLTLYHGAAPLRAWSVLAVEAGARRMGGDDGGDWRTRRWDDARMEPPVERDRRVIVSDSVEPPDLTGAVEWIPPTPEEAIPTPPRFVVHYDGGLGLEVLAVATDSARAETGLLHRTEHRLRRLLPRNWDRFRIRVRMSADEAGRLYRALPDSTSLLAVIPRP